jgi:glutathione peroxidase-family protein
MLKAALALVFVLTPVALVVAQDKPAGEQPAKQETPKKEEAPAKEGKEAAEKEQPKEAKADGKDAELPEDSLYKLKVKNIDGKEVDLKDYKGKVVLLVNVASKCGYTPQYEGLEKLYKDLKDKSFVVLGFPSNDFRNQEPGTAEEIKEFCTDKYGVTFPLFEKCQTKEGEGQSAVYANLKKQSGSLPDGFLRFA